MGHEPPIEPPSLIAGKYYCVTVATYDYWIFPGSCNGIGYGFFSCCMTGAALQGKLNAVGWTCQGDYFCVYGESWHQEIAGVGGPYDSSVLCGAACF